MPLGTEIAATLLYRFFKTLDSKVLCPFLAPIPVYARKATLSVVADETLPGFRVVLLARHIAERKANPLVFRRIELISPLLVTKANLFKNKSDLAGRNTFRREKVVMTPS